MAFEVLTAVFKVDSGSGTVFRKVDTFEQGCGIDIPNTVFFLSVFKMN